MLEYSKVQVMEEQVDMTIFRLQAAISKTLANPLRVAILYHLKSGEKTVNQLADLIGASQSNVSQHLALLRQRDLVKTRKTGSSVYYSVASPKISQACDMIREVLWEQLKQKHDLAKKYPQKIK
jgi:ArsR family transcriptional regulator, virulence genes transcriptional regulator